MAGSLQFELSSPQKRVANKTAAMVTVPGAEGYFGILVGHAPMASEIGAGVVELYEHDQTHITDRWFVVGGFCEVTTERCSVMSEQIIPIKDLKRDVIEAEIKALMADQSNDDAAAKLAIAQAKLMALA